MFPDLKNFVHEISNLFLLSAAVTLAGVLTIDVWRKSPTVPLAGLILGMVFGYGATVAAGEAWVVVWTLIGSIAGPNLIVWLQGEHVAAQIGQILLEKFGNTGKKNGSSQQAESTTDIRDTLDEREDR